MLDKPALPIENEIDETEEIPAIGIEITSSIGNSRQLTLRTGVKLTASPERINALLDKIVDASDRQKYRHDLMATEQLLANAQQDLYLNTQHKADVEARFIAQWNTSDRRGSWEPKGGQKQQLDNLQGNIDNAKKVIETHQKRIKELAEKCR